MRRFVDDLQDEYQRWVRIGNGETRWDCPVNPEPYYIPFIAHGAFIEPEQYRDTGLKRNIWDKLKDLTSKTNSGSNDPQSYAHLLDQLDIGQPPELLEEVRSGLTEFQLAFPRNTKLDNRRFEQFIYSLDALRFPVTFEILATPYIIVVQFVVDELDADIFSTTLHAFHPEIAQSIPAENDLHAVVCQVAGGEVISRELALGNDFYLPLSGFRDIPVDPYQGIFAQLGNLSEGDLIVIQINFSSCTNPWSQSIQNLVTGNEGGSFFSEGKEFLQGAAKKISKPQFGVVIRLSVFSETDYRCREIIRPLATAFGQFKDANEFVLADDDERDSVTRMVDITLRHFNRSGMILNGDELLALIHLPQPDVNAPKLHTLDDRTSEAPESDEGAKGLFLGYNEHRHSAREVILKKKDRLRHMHVVGASGTGKSTFIANCIIQDLHAGQGLALLDPHGDLVETVLKHIPEDRIKDVILFDPADAGFPIGFNILSAKTDIEKNLLASDFVSIFQRLSSAWGDQMTAVLENAVMAFLESTRVGTLLDLSLFLQDKKFREDFLTSVEDPQVLLFWNHTFTLLKGNTQASLVTRLDSFIRQKLVRNMIAQKGERLDFAEIMDQKKIFLAPLSQGIIGEENSWLLGSTLLSKFYQVALSRQQVKASKRKPFWLYVDEAHNFVTPSVGAILSGARKYGLGLLLAHQELAQFGTRDSGVLSSILTNAHTRICFKLGDQDARKLEEGFENFDRSDLRQLGTGEAICRIGGSQNDFNLRTSPPLKVEKGAKKRFKKARKHSRQTYGTPHEEVLESLKQYLTPPAPQKKVTRKRVQSQPSETEFVPPISVPPDTASVSPAQNSEYLEASSPAAPVIGSEMLKPPSVKRAKPTPEKVEKALPPRAKQSTAGRGGESHKSIQAQIKQLANGMGLRASIESELPDKSGSVDVLIAGQTTTIAIEIALMSPISQEVRNIEKCLPHGFDEIWIVSDNPKHLAEIRVAADEAGLRSHLGNVSFFLVDSLGENLSKFGALLNSSETQNLGYTVTTKFVPKSDTEVEDKKKRISKTVADAKRDLKIARQEKKK